MAFFGWAAKTKGSVTHIWVSRDEYTLYEAHVKPTLKSVKGTLKLHAVRPEGSTSGLVQVLWRETSCHCQDKDVCGCEWRTVTLKQSSDREPNLEDEDEECVDFDDNIGSDFESGNEPNDQISEDCSNSDQVCVGPGAKYECNWYLEQVLECDDEEVHTIFMKTKGRGKSVFFVWPRKEDELWIENTKVDASTKQKKEWKLNEIFPIKVEEAVENLSLLL